MKSNAPESELNHPSFLALDRAYLGVATADVAAHLERCDACRRHLASLASPAQVPSFEPRAPEAELGRANLRRNRWFGAASLAAVACGAILFVEYGKRDAARVDDAYVGEKGFRSVWIYVRRGAETQLWDGKQPLVAGDRLRLKIDAGSFHRVEVYSLSDPQNPTRLFEGAIAPGQTMTLPDAWEIDDSPNPEQLFVVFSDAPIAPSWEQWRQGKAPPGVAVLPFTLPKNNAPNTDAGQRDL